MEKVTKAVIPAAGFGTRFFPITKAMPKEMVPVVDKPVIQYVVEEAVASGCDDILIITGRNKRAIEDPITNTPTPKPIATVSTGSIDLMNCSILIFSSSV